MPSASSFLKRGSPSAWPDELIVINDPNHALFDERMALPISDERLRNLVAVGQIQPIAVRVEGDELVVTAGRQRWKMASVINGDSMEAGRAATSENEMRVDDPRDAKIRRAQRMAKQGHAAEDIADAFGFGVDAAAVTKVKRWLKVDLDKPREKKARGAATRPSVKILTDLATALRAADHDHDAAVLLDFAAGKITLDEAIKEWPGLADAVTAKKAKAA